jgi:hypothetical protein
VIHGCRIAAGGVTGLTVGANRLTENAKGAPARFTGGQKAL